jgi:hypothetical protein
LVGSSRRVASSARPSLPRRCIQRLLPINSPGVGSPKLPIMDGAAAITRETLREVCTAPDTQRTTHTHTRTHTHSCVHTAPYGTLGLTHDAAHTQFCRQYPPLELSTAFRDAGAAVEAAIASCSGAGPTRSALSHREGEKDTHLCGRVGPAGHYNGPKGRGARRPVWCAGHADTQSTAQDGRELVAHARAARGSHPSRPRQGRPAGKWVRGPRASACLSACLYIHVCMCVCVRWVCEYRHRRGLCMCCVGVCMR